MIIFKLVLGVLLLILSVYLGKCYVKKYSDRVSYLASLVSFNGDVAMEANFSKSTLKKLCTKIYSSGDFCTSIKNCVNSKTAGEKFICDIPEYICNEQKSSIYDYFEGLGKYDGKTTEIYCKTYAARFSEYLMAAEVDYKKYNSFYVKLSFLLGLALLVTVI